MIQQPWRSANSRTRVRSTGMTGEVNGYNPLISAGRSLIQPHFQLVQVQGKGIWINVYEINLTSSVQEYS